LKDASLSKRSRPALGTPPFHLVEPWRRLGTCGSKILLARRCRACRGSNGKGNLGHSSSSGSQASNRLGGTIQAAGVFQDSAERTGFCGSSAPFPSSPPAPAPRGPRLSPPNPAPPAPAPGRGQVAAAAAAAAGALAEARREQGSTYKAPAAAT